MLKDDKDGGWADGEKNRREALNGRLTPFWLMMGPPTLSFVLASSLRESAFSLSRGETDAPCVVGGT